MVLAIDLGNTNIVVGLVEKDKIVFEERFSTDKNKTAIEYSILIKNLFELNSINLKNVDGVIISSVVPQITENIKKATQKLFEVEPIIVSSELNLGFDILIDNKQELGADLIVGAAAGIAKFSLPLVIIDLGTATTFSYINENREFLGGIIMPGILTSLNSLVNNASNLVGISADSPKRVVGKNTSESMISGTIHGAAAMIDGMIERIETEQNTKVEVVATGGLSNLVIPYCKREIKIDNSLLIEGLLILYKRQKS